MTPANINPFTGDTNWQRLAAYLVGPAANGISLDSNGSLLVTTSSTSYTGTAPIRVNGSVISLTTTSPLFVSSGSLAIATTGCLVQSGTSLTVNVASPLFVNNHTLNLAVVAPIIISGTAVGLSISSPLAVSGGSLILGMNSPFGTSGGLLILNTANPTYINGGGFLSTRYAAPLTLDGSGNLTVDPTAYPTQTDSGEVAMASGDFTWGGTPPGSFLRGRYRWVKTGSVVTFAYEVEYSTAGVLNTAVQFALPGGTPTPAGWSSAASGTYIYGAGNLSNAVGGDTNGDGVTALYNNSGWGIQTSVNGSSSIAAKYATGSVTYFV